VEFFHTYTDSLKILGCTSCGRQAISLAGEGLLVCRGKFNFLLWIMVQFNFILSLTIYLNFGIFNTHCIFQLIDAAVDSFNTIVAKDGIVLNFVVLDVPDTLPNYLEKWRISLWESGFSTVFKGVCPFKKRDVFLDYRGATLLVKRVIYM
jgi:hypothetical protein